MLLNIYELNIQYKDTFQLTPENFTFTRKFTSKIVVQFASRREHIYNIELQKMVHEYLKIILG